MKEELVSQIHSIILHYSKYDKKWIDSGTTEAFFGVFESVVKRLKHHIDTEADTDQNIVECMILQIHGLLIEHLLKTLDVTKVYEVIKGVATASPLTTVMTNFYEFSTIVTNGKKLNEKIKIDIEKVKDTNKFATEITAVENEKQLLVLYASLSYFIQLLVSKFLEGLPVDLLHELTESCIILGKVSKKLLLVYNRPTNSKKDAKKVEEGSDKKMRVAMCNLIAYYRHLQLLHLILEVKFGTYLLIFT